MVLVAKKKSKPSAFGQRLKALRIAAGLTQTALAQAVEMKQPQLAALETSPATNPTLDTLRKLANALGCSVADLVTDEPE